MEPLLQVREALLLKRERLHRFVILATRDDAAGCRLMTMPGVGPVTALAFCPAIDDPARFSRSRVVGAHSGLTPRRYPSGETDRPGQISKQGDGLARQAPCQAANVLPTRTSRWSPLKAQVLSHRQAARTCGAPAILQLPAFGSRREDAAGQGRNSAGAGIRRARLQGLARPVCLAAACGGCTPTTPARNLRRDT
jgi:transposase